MSSTTPHIAQLGGLFIYSADPAALAAWYTTKLGIAFEGAGNSFYTGYPYQNLDGKKSQSVFSIMKAKARPAFDDKIFTLNLRTEDMDALVAHLTKEGIEVDGPQFHEGEGKFAWIKDLDGNFIELWEDHFEYK